MDKKLNIRLVSDSPCSAPYACTNVHDLYYNPQTLQAISNIQNETIIFFP